MLCVTGDFKEWQKVDLVVTAVACEFWGSCVVSFYWRPVVAMIGRWERGCGECCLVWSFLWSGFFGCVLELMWSVCGVLVWGFSGLAALCGKPPSPLLQHSEVLRSCFLLVCEFEGICRALICKNRKYKYKYIQYLYLHYSCSCGYSIILGRGALLPYCSNDPVSFACTSWSQ